MSTKLSQSMLDTMNEMSRYPVRMYGRTTQIKALAKRGMACQKYGEWVLTDTAMDLLEVDKNEVALKYANHFMRQGFQIRHNVQMVDCDFYTEEYTLRRSYYQRSFADEVNAVSSFMDRAIELARAEWRAGVAKAEIGLVG